MTEKTSHAWFVGENTSKKRISCLSGMTGVTLLHVLHDRVTLTHFFSCILAKTKLSDSQDLSSETGTMYELQKYRTRINALQISSAREMEFVMLICLGNKICNARLAFIRVRYFCTGYHGDDFRGGVRPIF